MSLRRGRFSTKRKRDAVLRLLKGRDLDLLARELGVNAPTLAGWREAFMQHGLSGLRSRAKDQRDSRIEDLERKLGQVTMDNELLNAKIDAMEAGDPLGRRRSKR